MSAIAITISALVSKKMIEEEVYNHLENVAVSRAHHVETLFGEHQDVVEILATEKVFVDAVTNQNDAQRVARVHQRIKKIIQVDEHISLISILDKNGNVVASDHRHTEIASDHEHGDIDKVAHTEMLIYGKKGIYMRDIHISAMMGVKVISISAPILVNNEFAGIIIVDVNVEKRLYQITTDRTGLGKSGEIYLINKEGYMITPSRFVDDTFLKLKADSPEIRKYLKLSQKNKKSKSPKIGIYENYRDITVIGTYFVIERLNWCLLAEIDIEDAFAPIGVLIGLLFWFFLIFLGVGVIFSLILTETITRPIMKLHSKAQEIEQGNWDYKVTIDTKDEIGQLSKAFDNMTTKLKNTQTALQKSHNELEIRVKERTAELIVTNKLLEREIVVRDQAEKALEKAVDSAESANRAKSEFLANMSHEIRTPMNAVIGFSELLSSLIIDKKQKSYLYSIEIAGKNLLTLINDILDLSKIEAGRLDIQYEPVNPYLIFNELKQIFALKIAEKNLEFIVDIDKALPSTLLLDETRLRQVLFNLIGNAIKFTDNGYIKLSIQKIYTKEDHSKVDLIISVIDTGVGIPNDQQDIIFESFRQQDGQSTRKYGGTGLGLAITKRLVEMMNGQISVKSTIDKESIFRIILRNVEVSVTAAPDTLNESFDLQNIGFENARVLVVDDIESNRNLIKEWLYQVNIEVIEAEDGQSALLFAEEYHPNLILMDIRMPVMDGYEATTKLKENPKTKEIPIIALTATAKKEDEIAKMKTQFGFNGYLSKPVNMPALINELSLYLKPTEKIVSVTKTTVLDSLENLTTENIVKISDMIEVMEKEIIPTWKEINVVMEAEAIEDFAQQILKLGKAYNVPALIVYAENMYEFSQNFDIKNLRNTLNKFPEIVKKLIQIKKEKLL
ncbi:ATP-binding protein [Candidatus Parabeggiatoa sp. HSG14]|uniref:hybrid sensor histidine kinase/response regulator n=1 Tax=Candidatus Parabeggiatoa sp. HSG14 TaxID=3055593 RepID=UPI0032E43249